MPPFLFIVLPFIVAQECAGLVTWNLFFNYSKGKILNADQLEMTPINTVAFELRSNLSDILFPYTVL